MARDGYNPMVNSVEGSGPMESSPIVRQKMVYCFVFGQHIGNFGYYLHSLRGKQIHRRNNKRNGKINPALNFLKSSALDKIGGVG